MGQYQARKKFDHSAVAEGATEDMPDDLKLKPRAIVPGGQRLPPPPELTALEQKYWVEFMAGMPAGWFGIETFPLLRLLCRYSAMAEVAMNTLNATAVAEIRRPAKISESSCA
jgi:hypothetical protein